MTGRVIRPNSNLPGIIFFVNPLFPLSLVIINGRLNSESILIAGATGLIGTQLSALLRRRGHDVAHLSRRAGTGEVRTFLWDPEEDRIDDEAVAGRSVIINLAGANIGGKRWTKAYKKKILESRTKSAVVLGEAIKIKGERVHTYISAAGTSIYGNHDGAISVTESQPPEHDFLARVCVAWEEAADKIASSAVRVVKLRTGPVLSGDGGLVEEFARPVRWFVGAPLGTGEQYISWIHIADLCNMYAFAVENRNLEGAYNAVAPVPVTNLELTQNIALALKRPLFLPPVPKFVLRLMLGEMAALAVEGCKVSAGKIIGTGFAFQFDTLAKAMDDIF